MNAVAFSLYGSAPKYCEGAVANAWLVPQVYPGWQMHVWVDDATVPETVSGRLRSLGAHLHPVDHDIPSRLYQRFLVHDLPDVERYVIRDCDSRVSRREKWCVDDWARAGTLLHTIHDHPWHALSPPIMGGLWGFWKAADKRPFVMKRLILGSLVAKDDRWGSDQNFLDEEIWPRYRWSVWQHGRGVPIALANEDPEAFCGEVIDENGRPNAQHREMRRRGTVNL